MQPTEGASTKAATTWDFGADTTLSRLLAKNAEVFPGDIAMREKSKGIWQQMTWQQVLDSMLQFAAGLESLGFKAGDVLLVVGDNRPRLYTGMISAGALGGYAMPAFPDATLDEVRHFVHEADARFVLAEDQEQVDKMLDLREQGASIAHIVYDDPRGLATYPFPG
ncbi:MAG: AMP-binding protein, partial [Rhizobiales bacterium]|nr:AMP-binding protein [Hyphomicrobiales bacterium]